MAALGHVAVFVDGIAEHLQSGAQGLDGSALLQPLLPGALANSAAAFAVAWCLANLRLLAYRVPPKCSA